MIFGVGTDIVAIARIQESIERLGDSFVHRILTPAERKVYLYRKEHSEKRGIQYLASRFAAKEAFSKACGTGIRDLVVWQNMQVLNDEWGAPQFSFFEGLHQRVSQQQWRVCVSLSDDHTHAIAYVLIEQTHNL
jgi:holo-[acyl-carrier protein] synthase